MKPPLSWYGGKQKMVKHLLPLLPKHTKYIEPFAGGAALFFAKPAVPIEVLNDTNGELVNFYRVMKHPRLKAQLIRRLEATPYSRACYEEAKAVYKGAKASAVKRAWAFFLCNNWAFANAPATGWAYGFGELNFALKAQSQVSRLPHQADRLTSVYLECDDALAVIDRWDAEDALFYLDPPYVDTDQGHYKGYTADDFQALLDKLATIKGSFILSHYNTDAVPSHWPKHTFTTHAGSAAGKNGSGKGERTEAVWVVLNEHHSNQKQLTLSLGMVF